METLRRETRVEHNRIENTEIMQRVFAADYELSEYRYLIARLFGFYRAIEPHLFTNDADDGIPLICQYKNNLLRCDLEALGATDRDIELLPICRDVPCITTLADRMGVTYVLEGATLGGQLIRRRLLGHFGDQVQPALNFYMAYGTDTGKRWRRFGIQMAKYFDTDRMDRDQRSAVIWAAKSTFKSLDAWLTRA